MTRGPQPTHVSATTDAPRRGRSWVIAALGLIVAFIGFPFLMRAATPPDATAPPWIAPYVDWGRQSLLINDDLGLAQFRYIDARCSGEAVALLFERRSYPYLTHTGAIALTGRWPPEGVGSFGGALFVDDYDQGLREGWVPERTWGPCEPA